MALEASIVSRLQELRQWQNEQQERLLQQQQAQRELLSHEQQRMFEALSLSVKDIADDRLVSQEINSSQCKQLEYFQSLENISDKAIDALEKPLMKLNVLPLRLVSGNKSAETKCLLEIPDNSCRNNLDGSLVTPKKTFRLSSCEMEGIEPLPTEKVAGKHVPIDDIPVPSPKKDFKTLLEERLRDSGAIENTKDDAPKTQIKRPFLKKGEGLARFRLNAASKPNGRNFRQRSASLSANMQFGNSKSTKTSEKQKEPAKSTTKHTVAKKIPETAQQHLSLKNVPPPRKKARSKSMSAVSHLQSNAVKNRMREVSDVSSSDLETKTKRELEEVRIFELLEEKAENSSFCSNSSMVIAFLQQSTPLKSKLLAMNTDKQAAELEVTNKRNANEQASCIAPSRAQDTKTRKDLPSLAYWNSALTNRNNAANFDAANGQNEGVSNTSRVDPVYNVDPPGKTQDRENGEENEADISLHVRFAEYNEYFKGGEETLLASFDTCFCLNFISKR